MVLQHFTQPNSIESATNPLPYIHAHFTLKGFQLGQALGVVWLFVKVLSKRQRFFAAAKSLPSSLKYTTLLGIAAANGFGHYKISQTPQDNNKRRFLLQRNIKQNLMDDMMIWGMIGGAAVSLITPARFLNAALFGGLLGTSTYLINYQILERYDQEFKFEKYL